MPTQDYRSTCCGYQGRLKQNGVSLEVQSRLTPQLPPDAREQHKPPSKGAVLEPKWLLSLSLSIFVSAFSVQGPFVLWFWLLCLLLFSCFYLSSCIRLAGFFDPGLVLM